MKSIDGDGQVRWSSRREGVGMRMRTERGGRGRWDKSIKRIKRVRLFISRGSCLCVCVCADERWRWRTLEVCKAGCLARLVALPTWPDIIRRLDTVEGARPATESKIQKRILKT